MAIDIRPIEPEEWARLRDIRLRALEDTPWAFGSTAEAERALTDSEWRHRLNRPTGAMFVAVDGDRWLGIAGVFIPDDRPATAHLVSMWVDPTARGRGVGHLLVDATLDWTIARDLDQIDLWVTDTNDPAIRLYTSSGFRFTGEHQPLPSDPALTERAMHRDLHGGLARRP